MKGKRTEYDKATMKTGLAWECPVCGYWNPKFAVQCYQSHQHKED